MERIPFVILNYFMTESENVMCGSESNVGQKNGIISFKFIPQVKIKLHKKNRIRARKTSITLYLRKFVSNITDSNSRNNCNQSS